MTASTVKSTQVSNAEAVPVSLSKFTKAGGKMRQYTATIEAAATSLDETGDIIHMLRVPSKLVPTRLMVYNDALDSDSALTADVGIYRADTGVVKDADALASAITTLRAANTAGVNILTEAQDIANIGKTLWELAGYTEDPMIDFLISITVVAAGTSADAGTISMVLEGALDN